MNFPLYFVFSFLMDVPRSCAHNFLYIHLFYLLSIPLIHCWYIIHIFSDSEHLKLGKVDDLGKSRLVVEKDHLTDLSTHMHLSRIRIST